MNKRIIIIVSYCILLLSATSCINDIERITNYPYKVGDFYSEGGVMGIVYKVSDGGVHGMIISLNEAECAWGDTYSG